MSLRNLLFIPVLLGVLLVASTSLFGQASTGTMPNAIYVKDGEGVPAKYNPPAWSGRKEVLQAIEEYKSKTDQHCFNQAILDLQAVFTKMYGKEIPVKFVKSASEVKAPAIVLGSLSSEAPFSGTLKDETAKSKYGEGFRIFTKNNVTCILGAGKYGSTYGVYELLNRMGVDYLFPGKLGEVIPSNSNITIPEIETEQVPSFVIRKPWPTGWIDNRNKVINDIKIWQIRNRIQANRDLTKEYHAGGHTWGYFRSKKYNNYYDKHPEIAAMRITADGKTTYKRWQINSTNPHAIDMVADYVREQFKKNNYPNDKDVTIGVGPADGGGFSQDPKSMELRRLNRDAVTGEWDNTDLMIKFTNDLFAKLLPEYPNLKLGFFSYHTYANFPVREKPHENLRIQIADITQSRVHGVCDAAYSPSRKLYKDTLEKWAENGTKFYFWHYDWSLADGLLPYTRIRIAGEDMPYEHKLGALGYQTESCYTTSNNAPHNYLEAKLMWDISGDWKEIIKDFCSKAYGKGGASMEKYYHFLVDKQARSGDETGSYFAYPGRYSREDVKKMEALLNKAHNSAVSAKEKRRVELVRYPVDQLKNYLDYYEAYTRFDFQGAQKAFAEIGNRYKKESAKKDHPLTANKAGAIDYPKYYIKAFVEGSVKYSAAPYNIIAKVPERMKFLYDMNDIGEKLSFDSPLLVDDEYPELSTYKSTLSRQGGIGFKKEGAAIWYRTRITLPELKLGKEDGIGIFLGGFDNNVTVYINGVKAGSAKGFLKPAVFDVTDLVDKTGKENSVIIKVIRMGNAEAATGGLIYPSFLFQGPRLPNEKKSVDTEDTKIVLPGAAGH